VAPCTQSSSPPYIHKTIYNLFYLSYNSLYGVHLCDSLAGMFRCKTLRTVLRTCCVRSPRPYTWRKIEGVKSLKQTGFQCFSLSSKTNKTLSLESSKIKLARKVTA